MPRDALSWWLLLVILAVLAFSAGGMTDLVRRDGRRFDVVFWSGVTLALALTLVFHLGSRP